MTDGNSNTRRLLPWRMRRFIFVAAGLPGCASNHSPSLHAVSPLRPRHVASVDASFRSGELWIRSDPARERWLLLNIRYDRRAKGRLDNSTAYFCYDPDLRKLLAADKSVWDSAAGRIAETTTHRGDRRPYKPRLSWEFQDRLRAGRGMPTVGRAIVQITTCPRGSIVAVMSVEGKRFVAQSLLPPLIVGLGPVGRPKIIEPCYLQLFAYTDGTPRGKPIRLRIAKDDIPYTHVWSPDGRYLVFTDESITNLFIIDARALEDSVP